MRGVDFVTKGGPLHTGDCAFSCQFFRNKTFFIGTMTTNRTTDKNTVVLIPCHSAVVGLSIFGIFANGNSI